MRRLPQDGVSIAAYIVPSDDVHQSEYINETDERRAYISGFQGSSGTAVVTDKKALLWTDGRYYQQAQNQIDDNWTLMKDGLATTPSISDWLLGNLKKGDIVGVDGNLFSYRSWNPLATALELRGMQINDR